MIIIIWNRPHHSQQVGHCLQPIATSRLTAAHSGTIQLSLEEYCLFTVAIFVFLEAPLALTELIMVQSWPRLNLPSTSPTAVLVVTWLNITVELYYHTKMFMSSVAPTVKTTALALQVE